MTTTTRGLAARFERGDSDVALMRRVAIAMFLLGGLTCLLGAQTGIASPIAKQAQEVVALALTGTGMALAVVRRPSRSMLVACAFWGVALVSALVAFADPVKRGDFFYLWPVLYAAYFCSVPIVAAVYGWMVATFALALVLHTDHPSIIDALIGTVSTVGLVAALVVVMTFQQARLRSQLATAAETDPLTGLLNRRSFNPRLDHKVLEALTSQRPLSVVMFDLDHFKRLNDQHGHLVGDRVLETFGRVLTLQSRDGDLVCRFGGEEFAVVLPGATADDARAFAERVAATLAEDAGDVRPSVTVSAGIGILTADDRGGEPVIQRADEALYAAKAAGRCRSATFAATMELGPRFGEPTPV